MIRHVVSAMLFLLAGWCLFLLVLNRVAINYRDSLLKTCMILLIAGILTAGPVYVGYRIGFSVWLLLPATVLASIVAGEIRRALIRFRCQGSPPVEKKHVHTSLKRPLTSTDLNIARYEIHIPNWHGQMLRIAHISDLHIHARYPMAFYQEMIALINTIDPDLLFITGDFVTKLRFISLLPDILTPLGTRHATFAILGNHDYWAGAELIAETIRTCGIDIIGNEYRRLESQDHPPLVICGYEHPWNSDMRPFPPCRKDELLVVLTHTPDNIYDLSATDATAVFAGHYHAGQLRLPYLGSIVIPSIYGRRFDHGHFVVNGTHLFVTAGIGSVGFLFRLYCHPDIFVVDIVGTK